MVQGEDDSYGCDRYVMLASILRHIYKRHGQRRSITQGEQRVVRGPLVVQDTSTGLLDCISKIALTVAPASDDTDEERASPQ